jgi:hypothetical protein
MRFLSALLTLLLSTSVWAQPSNEELFASYCVGVFDARLALPEASLAACFSGESPASCRERTATLDWDRKDEAFKRGRFLKFLDIRGSGTAEQGEAAKVAHGLGRADWGACMASLAERFPTAFGMCQPKCGPGTLDKQACDKCYRDKWAAPCQAAYRCDEPSRLPF